VQMETRASTTLCGLITDFLGKPFSVKAAVAYVEGLDA
jgi:hypothetical protein